MVFRVFVFIFCLETTLMREQLDETDLRRCYGNFFSKASFRTYLITAMFKVLSQQLRGTLITACERYPTIEDITDMVNIGVKPAPRRLTYYCMLLFLSNKPSF